MAHVRSYQPSDEEAVVHIFRETAHKDFRNHPDPLTLQVGEWLWCRPYYKLLPEWVFVLDDGAGKAVGYILCAPDTTSFVQQWRKEILPMLPDLGIHEPAPEEDIFDMPVHLRHDVYTPEELLHTHHPNLVEQHPAHLHIDILDGYQRQGWGQKLIAALFQKALSESVPGIWLGATWDNADAARFYERLGFEKFGEMNDEGTVGRWGNGLYMVRRFQRENPK